MCISMNQAVRGGKCADSLQASGPHLDLCPRLRCPLVMQVLDSPAPQTAEQHPILADVAAAIAEEPALAEDASLAEDEEADAALTAFDHEEFDGAVGQTVVLSLVEAPTEASPQPEVSAAEASTPVVAVGNSFVNSAGRAQGGIAGIIKGWIAAVVKMFQEWQNALAR